jgi:hypothetical protein
MRIALMLVVAVTACVPPAAAPAAPASAAAPPAPGADAAQPPESRSAGVDARQFTFNGRAATAEDLQVLAQIEQMYGRPAPAGSYWYDPVSGAAGAWGGPTLGFLPVGLALGGPLPPEASGGGYGLVTGVFVNGREVHPVDVQVLTSIVGQIAPGRYWLDGQGNAGTEGGPAIVNLVERARQRGSSAESYLRDDGNGNSVFIGGGCVSGSATVGSGSSEATYSFYSAGC